MLSSSMDVFSGLPKVTRARNEQQPPYQSMMLNHKTANADFRLNKQSLIMAAHVRGTVIKRLRSYSIDPDQ